MPDASRSLACAAIATMLLAAGCSGSSPAGAGKQVGEVSSVSCPSEASAVALPAGWSVPLPSGTVVVDVHGDTGGRTIVTGVVPQGESAVLHAMQQRFAQAGLKLTEGETEQHDAESNFTGAGITGRWGIRELPGCPTPATRVDIVVRKT